MTTRDHKYKLQNLLIFLKWYRLKRCRSYFLLDMEQILLMTKSFYSCMFFLTQEILTSLTRATRGSILMTHQRPSVSQNFDSGNETPPNLPKSCKFLRQSHAAKDRLAMGYRGPLHAFETFALPMQVRGHDSKVC